MAFVLASNGFERTNPQLRGFAPNTPQKKKKQKKENQVQQELNSVAPDFDF